MNALFNVLVLTLGTALGPSAPAVTVQPGAMLELGSLAPYFSRTAVAQARGGEIPPPSQQATCTATCGDGSNVTCTGNTCTAVNQDCSTDSGGYVDCDGTRTSCPVCPASCTFRECRQGCSFCRNIGCFSDCLSVVTCECDCICN